MLNGCLAPDVTVSSAARRAPAGKTLRADRNTSVCIKV